MVVAVMALVAALAGTAVAGPDASTSALNKKKAKKIAKKQINKLAPGLSVANAENLDGQPASAFLSNSGVRFAKINADGTVSANAKGIAQANVTKEGAGFYCLAGLNPAPNGVQVSADTGASINIRTFASIKSGPGVCAGKQVIVQTYVNTTATDQPFNVVVF
jgi:hypothetical protein